MPSMVNIEAALNGVSFTIKAVIPEDKILALKRLIQEKHNFFLANCSEKLSICTNNHIFDISNNCVNGIKEECLFSSANAVELLHCSCVKY